MFKDYYLILGISEFATPKEIKEGFIKQALKWHPDKNIGKDTTSIMQDINEAYIILKDEEARYRYNIEYQSFKNYQRNIFEEKRKAEDRRYNHKQEEEPQSKTASSYEYNIKDDVLKRWIEKAKEQASKLAKDTLDDLIGMSSSGFAEIKKNMGCIIFVLILSVVGTIIAFMVLSSRSN